MILCTILANTLWANWGYHMMSEVGDLEFTAISEFFEHDNGPEGPHFRAVSRLFRILGNLSLKPGHDERFLAEFCWPPQETVPNLGLLDHNYSTDEAFDPRKEKPQWERLINYLYHLNHAGASKHKLFFIIRHGEGYHNVKEAQVGRAEWEVSLPSKVSVPRLT